MKRFTVNLFRKALHKYEKRSMERVMKGFAVEKDGSLHHVEIPMPTYHPYQAMVRMVSCGVCNGTDMKLIHHSFKDYFDYPAILGHEGVGEVVEVGKKVTSFKVGDKVTLPFLEGKFNEYYSAWGGYAEYAVVGDIHAMLNDGKGVHSPEFSDAYYAQQIVPEDIDAVGASMIITWREVLSACKDFGFKANQSLIVFGAGPVGASFIKFAKLMGMGPIIIIERSQEKIEIGKTAGADFGFINDEAVVEKVRKILPDGSDFIVDAVGVNEIINKAMLLVKYYGKICVYGISSDLEMNLNWKKSPYNWILHFFQWPDKYDESQCHKEIVEWIRMGYLDPKEFISHIIDFSSMHDAFQMLETKHDHVGPIIKKIAIKF